MSWEKIALVFVISLCLPLSGCLGPSEEGDTRIDSVTLVERPNPVHSLLNQLHSP